MSRNKPLSKEEKRQRLKALFNETREVYLIKELEKIAPKEKGIVSKTVEEVLKELVDDGIVHSEKIGTSVYFWGFPSEEFVNKKVENERLEQEIRENCKRIEEVKEENEKLKRERGGDEGREMKEQEVERLRERKEEIMKELEIYKENDPDMIKKLKEQVQKSKEAANRWTDGIFMIQTYAKERVSVPIEELNKGLGIPNDLDYLD
ncbi:Mnd1 family protein [Entamoeba histolytica HM-1:IMSS-B]|uniref:Meiotic coiled-coil protein n=6 Tax=Entamoeba histolytica TaxID=5759 RepID=C4M8I3_ENTH1|nr:hypothetical protein, conserved [Entamoeba histolytica HM-1:IMSS]EMD42783.1 meiotic coiledcoil protein, putative [Entamoeba histolytica KU27]EMH76248.1 Mnd1 family protein [Entamoeba histolytica HM-1:IMSS-B]EMS16622.1 meiotic coiled-coil protein, putative [Entamoeba histolytica HM-3:IMSS]ENY60651.1 meiotic coiled-coil protein, putative [Entamoeba histolytica HM-1:IMSS-A]GAT97909.1 hypothetical protein conserved [Entamoeba histolytica]|eukprot:XP_651120.2 hypothetical protein, conserved [Entamoeba histolytica HM-1:IMSS]